MGQIYEQSDETLCSLAASGDRIAEECLAVRYGRLVRVCARPYFLAGGDSEDLIQEGMIGLLSAIRGFSPEKEANFRTYAQVCIQNRLRSAVKAAARGKHQVLNQSVPLEEQPFDEGAESYPYGVKTLHISDPEDELISREDREDRMKLLQSKLSGFEQTVLELYLGGLSYGEIAQRLRKPLKSVDNAVQRIRRKVSPFLTSGDTSAS